MTLLADYRFSQSSLQDYVDCNYRFLMRHVLRQPWPAPEAEPAAEHERHMREGEQFHRLVHRHLAGISAETLTALAASEPLTRWWQAYLQSGLKDLPVHRYPEVSLAAKVEGWWLFAKYDLVAIEPGKRAVIVDWKTSKKPGRSKLADHLQTIVYRYVLVTAGSHLNSGTSVDPEHITMRYWFAEEPDAPVTLPYDSVAYNNDGERLSALMNTIVQRNPDESAFPRTEDTRHCVFCNYRSLCNRGVKGGHLAEMETAFMSDGTDWEFDINFDQIPEIEF